MDVDELRTVLADLAAEGKVSGDVTAALVERVGGRRRRARRAAVSLACVVAMLGVAGGAAAVIGGRHGSPSTRVSVDVPTTRGKAHTTVRMFTVPSASMAPGLEANERVKVDTSWYGRNHVHRGDVVVFV